MIEGSISHIGHHHKVRKQKQHNTQEPVIPLLIEERECCHIYHFGHHRLDSTVRVHPNQYQYNDDRVLLGKGVPVESRLIETFDDEQVKQEEHDDDNVRDGCMEDVDAVETLDGGERGKH